MTKYEYVTVFDIDDTLFNVCGAKGFRLVKSEVFTANRGVFIFERVIDPSFDFGAK